MQVQQPSVSEVAVVTGGAGEIGRAICLALADQGAAVVALDISGQGAQETARLVQERGSQAHGATVDVTDRAAVAAAIKTAEEAFGPLTVSVSCHGIGPGASVLDITEELWNQVLAVNLTGTLIVGQEAGRRMVASGYGRIINIGSTAAHFPSNEIGCYMVSKGAVEALTRVMAFELGPHGVTVNTVAPGAVYTKLLREMQPPEAEHARVIRTSVGRLGEPSDIAAAVCYAASRAAGYMTGSIITVDGGYSIGGIRAVSNRDAQ